jgi:hypothetical protein
MNQEWAIQRRVRECRDGERRWDLAYQCLLRWTQNAKEQTSPNQTSQEVQDASSDLCAGIDARTSAGSDH